ncbi:MAG: hypothetical protein ACOC2N_01710 [Spirochaetota bacterium]
MTKPAIETTEQFNTPPSVATMALIEAHERLELLLANRSRLKAIGDPGAIRREMRASVLRDAARRAIAEDVLQSKTLYGAQMRAEYIRRCAEIGVGTALGQ